MTDAPPRDPRIVHLELVERHVVRRSPDIEHERRVAIFDLLEANHFSPETEHSGPYHVRLSVEETRLIFDIRDQQECELLRVPLPLIAFRNIVKDYFRVCESYFAAIKSAPPHRIEAIDAGRRGLHDEGSVLLREQLAGRIAMDHDTARRLFTLLCVLHMRG
jgi:uncharacterized protein (UPF0262 family)